MRDMNDFAGQFGDFQTMFLDTDFDSYVVRFYDDAGSAVYKQVIGYTELNNGEILLHMVDAECCDTWEELDESLEDHGVQFQTLTKMLGEDGFDIIPMDQPVDDEDYCDDCGELLEDCECEDDDDCLGYLDDDNDEPEDED